MQRFFALSLGIVPLSLTACGSLERAAGVAAGFASHQLCSATFVSRVEPEAFYREAIAPTMSPVGFLLSHKVDRDKAEVTTSFAGLAESRAVYRGELGCLVVHDPLPGADWNYTNGTTLLLSKLIRDNAGGTASSTLAFARRELFDKLGMRHVTLEFDAVGTPIGSSHMLASARDWARFGLLYLDDGVVGGERILPEGWVDYSATLTPHSEQYGYAAGFWTQRGTTGGAAYRVKAGLPADSFMARGAYGQYVIVVPSQRLVVARFGTAFTPRDDMDIVARLVTDVIDTLQ